MHSLAARTNAVWSITMVCVASCAIGMGVISFIRHEYISPSRPTGSIKVVENFVNDVVVAHPMQHISTRQLERAVVRMDIDADFTDCFDWNTKQVFVYVVAEYATADHPRNEATLYDTIITSREEARLTLQRVADYPLMHITSSGLAGNSNVTLRLKYHIMCHSGMTHVGEVGQAAIRIQMPSKKVQQGRLY